MPDIQQNTLYLTTHGSYVGRDHLTLQVEVPVYPEDLPREERSRERASDWRKLSIPTCWSPFAYLARAASARRRWICAGSMAWR